MNELLIEGRGDKMNFTIENLKELSFRRTFLFGYKKSDVQDFLRYVREDYDDYELKDQENERLHKALEKKKEALKEKNNTLLVMAKESASLQEENERLFALELEKKEIDRMREMAQEAANLVEEESKKMYQHTQDECKAILHKAEEERMNAQLDIQIALGELNRDYNQLLSDYETKKQELLTLEYQCHELEKWKEQAELEAAVFKQELSTIKDQLVKNYTDSLEEFLKENPLFEEKDEHPTVEPIVQLHSKRVV